MRADWASWSRFLGGHLAPIVGTHTWKNQGSSEREIRLQMESTAVLIQDIGLIHYMCTVATRKSTCTRGVRGIAAGRADFGEFEGPFGVNEPGRRKRPWEVPEGECQVSGEV